MTIKSKSISPSNFPGAPLEVELPDYLISKLVPGFFHSSFLTLGSFLLARLSVRTLIFEPCSLVGF